MQPLGPLHSLVGHHWEAFLPFEQEVTLLDQASFIPLGGARLHQLAKLLAALLPQADLLRRQGATQLELHLLPLAPHLQVDSLQAVQEQQRYYCRFLRPSMICDDQISINDIQLIFLLMKTSPR